MPARCASSGAASSKCPPKKITSNGVNCVLPSASPALHLPLATSALLAGVASYDTQHAAAKARAWQLRYLGDPILATVCTPVTLVAGTGTPDIPDGLLDAMHSVLSPGSAHRRLPDPRAGLGIAANQLGCPIRLILARIPKHESPVVMVNPVITRRSDVCHWQTDGCLSIPGFGTTTKRHATVSVEFFDLGWHRQALALSSLSAAVVQHEVDHLDGKTIVDGKSRQVRRQAEREVAKLMERAR